MYKHFFKRLFDIIVSLCALPFVLLVIIIFAPVIWLTDRGPVFYNAERLGKKGKVFKMYKLRSMKVNSPNLRNADGSTYNADDDPRVTKVGRFMRKTSIDELPQFLNVLFGHMSLIGPRAHLTTNYKGYDLLAESRKRRIDVRPGLTGYNQAFFRNSVTTEEKVKNDVYYVDHLSFALDVKIFFATIVSVLRRKNIYVKADAPVNAEATALGQAEEVKTEETVKAGE